MIIILLEKVYLVTTLIFTGIIIYTTWSWKSHLREFLFLGFASLSILIYVLGIYLLFEGYPIVETIIIAEIVFAFITCLFIKFTVFKKGTYIASAIIMSVGLLMYEYYFIDIFSLYELSLPNLAIVAAIIFAVLIVLLYRNKHLKKLVPFLSLMFIGNVLMYFANGYEALFVAIIIKITFYMYFIGFLKSIINQDIKVTVEKSKKVSKEFDDAVKKEVNKHMFYLELSKDKIKEQSKIDDLTRAFNKKAILDMIDKMIAEEKFFSIMMFDIDNFKTINDTHGHVFGDKILKILANITRQSLRDQDVFGRYGGDEFIVIVPRATIQETRIIAERLRINVEQTKNINYTLTISIGLANYPEDATNTRELIEYADTGLYISKERGRNTTSHKINNNERTYY